MGVTVHTTNRRPWTSKVCDPGVSAFEKCASARRLRALRAEYWDWAGEVVSCTDIVCPVKALRLQAI